MAPELRKWDQRAEPGRLARLRIAVAGLTALSLVALAPVGGGSAGAAQARTDGRDVSGPFDVRRVSDDATPAEVVYTLQTYRDFGDGDFGAMQWMLDFDADAVADACVFVSRDSSGLDAGIYGSRCTGPEVASAGLRHAVPDVIQVTVPRGSLHDVGLRPEANGYAYTVKTRARGASTDDLVPDARDGKTAWITQTIGPAAADVAASAAGHGEHGSQPAQDAEHGGGHDAPEGHDAQGAHAGDSAQGRGGHGGSGAHGGPGAQRLDAALDVLLTPAGHDAHDAVTPPDLHDALYALADNNVPAAVGALARYARKQALASRSAAPDPFTHLRNAVANARRTYLRLRSLL